jgi:hypothetical protein
MGLLMLVTAGYLIMGVSYLMSERRLPPLWGWPSTTFYVLFSILLLTWIGIAAGIH